MELGMVWTDGLWVGGSKSISEIPSMRSGVWLVMASNVLPFFFLNGFRRLFHTQVVPVATFILKDNISESPGIPLAIEKDSYCLLFTF